MAHKVGEYTEASLREQVRDLARLLGYHFYFVWTSIHSPRGFPDIVLARPPRLVFAELKSAKGKVSEHQQAWLDTLKACGQEVYVWRPDDFNEIVRILQ